MSARILVIAIGAALAAACGSAVPKPSVSTSASNLIVRSELESLGPITAYDAIRRLRPAFLRGRGAVALNQSANLLPVVFAGDAPYGTLDILKQIDIARIAEIRYYTAPEATTKFGSGYSSGVIALKMRAQ